jgi:crotonobetainyl-CoA:carnitine CoA-transferase CaiB-like acyl-CoA transferase
MNPNLVYLSATAYGERGPDANRAAFHSTPNALTGAGILQGGAGNPPVDDSYPDPCSALAGAVALAMGLYHRQGIGRGQFVETTMLASSGYVMSNALIEGTGHPDPSPNDRLQHGPNPLTRIYQCAQGWVALAIHQDNEWDRFVAAIGIPALRGLSMLAASSGDGAAKAAESIPERMIADTADGWQATLTAQRVPCAVVNPTPIERVLQSTGRLLPRRDRRFGEYWRLPPRINYATYGSTLRPGCRPGEHSQAILSELGFAASEVSEFVEKGVVGSDRRLDAMSEMAVPV